MVYLFRTITYINHMDIDCMLWAGSLNSKGYAQVSVKVNGKWTVRTLHRELYYVEKDDVADGFVLDHLCSNRSCINTDHLEPVTNAENLRRGIRPSPYGTHCNQGHNLSSYGYYVDKRGCKTCKECKRIRNLNK